MPAAITVAGTKIPKSSAQKRAKEVIKVSIRGMDVFIDD
jgi:hypothetical protein